MPFHLSRSTRLMIVIGISSCFFLVEISVGFYTHSLALIADAFHYLNDLVGFVIALVALKISESDDSPKDLSFGWQRAQLLGSFFNGVLLFALGISILLQAIDRFISLHRVEDPRLMFIVGSIGLGLNIISAVFLHEHGHGHAHVPSPSVEDPISPSSDICDDSLSKHHNHKHHHSEKLRSSVTGKHDHSHGHSHDHGDLGMWGVFLHVICDAANNLGVMVAALVIWFAKYDGRYYADPGVSMGIAVMITLSSLPLVRRSGLILLESVPTGVDMKDVQHDLEQIPGVHSIHELHIWRLNQNKSLASVHVVVDDHSVTNFLKTAKIINECFHAYGIHSTTLQPEVLARVDHGSIALDTRDQRSVPRCQIVCGAVCGELTCCG
ncbi:hypothetical protein N7474_010646 [Penicillium riverlandense]|uniref:uncharacterized protein n=1 Tax=Penicillium riverlandense TaxID=1903569 RepID=UPI0025475927|nr:uncharacterized protein N7474_010646 [Penicillium riverlandense]KAJ5807054.1 hypothetical protein N7474_010646 [Penicillium riverlandense]